MSVGGGGRAGRLAVWHARLQTGRGYLPTMTTLASGSWVSFWIWGTASQYRGPRRDGLELGWARTSSKFQILLWLAACEYGRAAVACHGRVMDRHCWVFQAGLGRAARGRAGRSCVRTDAWRSLRTARLDAMLSWLVVEAVPGRGCRDVPQIAGLLRSFIPCLAPPLMSPLILVRYQTPQGHPAQGSLPCLLSLFEFLAGYFCFHFPNTTRSCPITATWTPSYSQPPESPWPYSRGLTGIRIITRLTAIMADKFKRRKARHRGLAGEPEAMPEAGSCAIHFLSKNIEPI